MAPAQQFAPHDLVLFVWPSRASFELPPGAGTRSDAASSSWAMERAKAERVSILISVYDDVVIGAWAVTGTTSTLATPAGKSRRVNRAVFSTRDDPRLHHLLGRRSQVRRRRNPQTTIELRDLVGAEVLLDAAPAGPDHGVVRLGEFTLTVHEDGTADLLYPARSAVTLRPEA